MRWFKAVDPVVQSLSGWATLLAAFYAVIGFLSPIFAGLHWTEVILLGIAASLATLFAIAAIAAIGAWGFRQIRPLPAPAPLPATPHAEEIEPPTPYSWDDPNPNFTGVERERASKALCAVVDFATTDALRFYEMLNEADSAGPWAVVQQAESFEPARARVSGLANGLWHEHSYYLDLMHFDIMPLLQTLEALKNPMEEAAEAETWPVNAQADRARPISQLMSDLNGHIHNIRRDAVDKRREYLE